MTTEQKQKEILKLKQSKGQLEASIAKLEPYLQEHEFKDYNDYLYSAITFITIAIKRLNDADTKDVIDI